ncbi:MAG: NAD(P) transhydrogenase subunit alpha [Actinomycetota bacterium]
MLVGVRHERLPNEKRVALVPASVEHLVSRGHDVVVEHDAGAQAGYDNGAYEAAGATIGDAAAAAAADISVGVRPPSDAHLDAIREGSWQLAPFDPLWDSVPAAAVANAGAAVFSLDLVPRTTKAQTMDVLSSMATIAGYEAVLLAASNLPRLFPMLTTAAGTLPPARALVLGAGVAGLQAIATARRLGAVVSGYDIRPAAAEQIRSVGAKSIELELETGTSEDAGGYATAQSADTGARQQDLLAPHVADADVLITTAAIPGRASPLLVTSEMVAGMGPGGVVIDLAAERGGNVEPSQADVLVDHGGVTILGPTDLPSRAPSHASLMFANNVVKFLDHAFEVSDGLIPDRDDEILGPMLVALGGSLVHPALVDADPENTPPEEEH